MPYLYKNTGGVITWIACNDHDYLGDPQFMPSSINGVLDPGQYYLVVDGIDGLEGNYVLHVNAMPDGTPFAAPNYDEALAAYTAIGGKVVGVDASGYGCNVAPHQRPQLDAAEHRQLRSRSFCAIPEASTAETTPI